MEKIRPNPSTDKCICGKSTRSRNVAHQRACPDYTAADADWCVAQRTPTEYKRRLDELAHGFEPDDPRIMRAMLDTLARECRQSRVRLGDGNCAAHEVIEEAFYEAAEQLHKAGEKTQTSDEKVAR